MHPGIFLGCWLQLQVSFTCVPEIHVFCGLITKEVPELLVLRSIPVLLS